jgi:hypothetical protein
MLMQPRSGDDTGNFPVGSRDALPRGCEQVQGYEAPRIERRDKLADIAGASSNGVPSPA